MTSEDIRKFWLAQPFRPFIIRLIDERSFVVRHPDFIWSTPPSRRTVTLVDEFDDEHTVNTTVIVSIEYDKPARQPDLVNA